jgi:hypothetical protein
MPVAKLAVVPGQCDGLKNPQARATVHPQKINPAHDFTRDIFGGIFGPTFGGVESNDANRAVN